MPFAPGLSRGGAGVGGSPQGAEADTMVGGLVHARMRILCIKIKAIIFVQKSSERFFFLGFLEEMGEEAAPISIQLFFFFFLLHLLT